MDRIGDVLGLLNTIIHFTIDGMVNIKKENLFDIQTCLRNAHEKIEFLQLESQFQQDELK